MADPKVPKPAPFDMTGFFVACFVVGGGLAIALYHWPAHHGPPARAVRRVR